MSENDESEIAEITEALGAMGDGDTLTFENGAIVYREGDSWEVTLPGEEPESQAFFRELSAAADEYEPGGPRGPKLTPEQAFRRMLGGGSNLSKERSRR